MAAAKRCPYCGFESDDFPDRTCPQCGKRLLRSVSFPPWLLALAQAALGVGVMFAFHFPRPMILGFALVTFFLALFGLRSRRTSAISNSVPRPLSPQPKSAVFLGLTIALLGLACFACLLFGFIIFLNAQMAIKRVARQPYHATTFQVIRPYYQKSAGFHGPEISVYASGMVGGNKEWMDLFPYLKRNPSGQGELNALVPPGTTIPVYLFPNLKGRSRIQVIDVLPPGEAARRIQAQVLRRVPVALVVLGALMFVLVRIRRSLATPAAQATSVGV